MTPKRLSAMTFLMTILAWPAIPAIAQDAIPGVVVNQTVTVAGQEFFQHFVAAWRERPLAERFAISVTERPSARWGSQVWVEFAQRRVFHTHLPAGRSGLRPLGERAAEIAFQRVADTEVERLLFREPDLGADEL
ncbi:MAG TPA: CsgE family curli-type amyloid fiber assembly protein [Noviherbaspirillum sp.]|jgi:curli production assembly/transport component CsgE|uniref:CsgE family curli-type amyloid fiber assembly protein n=1 Tax=Noviherbaspirillum sp. TaxID=1926288 RepID=UPI002F952F65